MWGKSFGSALGVLASAVLCGCAALLPDARSEAGHFSSFDEARSAIAGLESGRSNRAQLVAMGLDPKTHSNAVLLTHADVVRRFVPGSVLTVQDLDPGIAQCLQARDACTGVEFTASRIHKQREGNFWADFFNFSRRTHTTGWRFQAVVLLVGDQVVYRNWGGQPVVNENDVQNNPLGPLQDIGPATVTKQ
ncbi:MAG: hypothetical protein ACT4NV_13015 [Rhodoferax sp.]